VGVAAHAVAARAGERQRRLGKAAARPGAGANLQNVRLDGPPRDDSHVLHDNHGKRATHIAKRGRVARSPGPGEPLRAGGPPADRTTCHSTPRAGRVARCASLAWITCNSAASGRRLARCAGPSPAHPGPPGHTRCLTPPLLTFAGAAATAGAARAPAVRPRTAQRATRRLGRLELHVVPPWHGERATRLRAAVDLHVVQAEPGLPGPPGHIYSPTQPLLTFAGAAARACARGRRGFARGPTSVPRPTHSLPSHG
jgi:hypothetical protein